MTALHELRKHVLVAPRVPYRLRGRGPASRALPDPGGDPIEVPSGCALWLAAFSSACRESRLPLTSCRGRARAEAHTRRLKRPTSMPRQRHRFVRSQTPSIDECPLDPALAHRISNAGPPPCRGFATPDPASDAPSLSRPVRGRGLDLAALRSSSLRCARGHASFVDFCQRDDPQARPSDDRHPAASHAPTRLSPDRHRSSGQSAVGSSCIPV